MSTVAASEKRARAKQDYDAFLAGCPGPSPRGGRVGEPRPLRYSELSRRLSGVSQKMLTQTLRALERDGVLTRTVTPTVPVTVTYELTELGLSLQELMLGVKGWA